jgi:hypothetical protein
LKDKISMARIQRVLIYGSKTCALKVCSTQRLERTEMMMVRWMCGVIVKDRRSNQKLLDRLGIVWAADLMRHGRLRWFGHLERKGVKGCDSKC